MTFPILLLFLSFQSFAVKDIAVSASADRQQVPLGGVFQFQIRVAYKGKRPEHISEPNPSDMKGFDFVSKESGFASHISIVNGRAEAQKILSYNYILQPKAKGWQTLKGLKIRIDGKDYALNSVSVLVVARNSKAPSQSPPSGPSFPLSQLPGQILKDFLSPSFPDINEPAMNTQLKLELEKDSYYVGEMIKARWIVFISSPRAQVLPIKKPDLKGFLQEELLPQGQPKFLGTEVLDQTLYRKTLFQFLALFPIKAGSLEIDKYDVRIHSSSLFSLSGGLAKRIKTFPSRVLNIKPLPAAPSDFSGGVGTFHHTVWLDQKEIPFGQPVTFRLKISGEGHPQFINLPEIPFPLSLQVYPAVEQSRFSSEQESYKEFEILLIPKAPGDVLTPEFQFSTFDPHKEAYVQHRVSPLSFKVLKGIKPLESETEKFFKVKEPVTKKQFGLLKANPKSFWLFSQDRLKCFWLILFSLIGVVFLLVCFSPLVFQRRLQIKKELFKRLEQAKKSAKKGLFEQCSLQLLGLLQEALLSFPESVGSRKKDIISALPPALREKQGVLLKALMEELEAAAYSRDKSWLSKAKMQGLIDKTEQLINEWISYIKS